MVIADASDLGFAITMQIQMTTNSEILLRLYTHILWLFDIITKAMTAEESLIIDSRYIKNAYDNEETDDLLYIYSELAMQINQQREE